MPITRKTGHGGVGTMELALPVGYLRLTII